MFVRSLPLQVYKVKDLLQGKFLALKCERVGLGKKCVLKMEATVLKEMRKERCIPRFYGCGRCNHFNYVVMGLVGENLSSLRKQLPKQRFSTESVCEIAAQALHSMQCLHQHGVLHRDIKPSNFAVGGVGSENKIFLLDFGLSRIYRMPDHSVRVPRKHAGFRGTARYACVRMRV